jgi:hypothetical protein
MITRMKNRLPDRARTDPNQEPPNTTRKTATVIKISSMGDMVKNITLMAILKVMTTRLKKTTMTCGDCNIDSVVARFS